MSVKSEINSSWLRENCKRALRSNILVKIIKCVNCSVFEAIYLFRFYILIRVVPLYYLRTIITTLRSKLYGCCGFIIINRY